MVNRWALLLLGCFCLTFGLPLLEAHSDPLVNSTPAGLLAVDSANDSVLSFDPATGAFRGVFISAGSGGLTTAESMTTGPDGNVYVASWSTASVKRYDGTTGAFRGDFLAAGSGGLGNPDQVVFGPDGNLYVSDRFAASIRRYNGTTGAFIDTFVSNGALGGFISFTFGPDGNIYAGMFNGSQDILRFDGTSGAFIDVFNSGNPSLDSAVSGLVFGPDGNLYAGRYHANLVQRYDGTTGAFIDTFVSAGSGGLHIPDYLTFGPDGNLYVSGILSNAVLRYDGTTGAFIDAFASGGSLTGPTGITFTLVGPLGIHPSNLKLTSRGVGKDSKTKFVKVRNPGTNRDTAVTSFSIDNSQFQVDGENVCGASLPIGQRCQVGIRFKPTTSSTQHGTLTIDGNFTNHPRHVDLTGVVK